MFELEKKNPEQILAYGQDDNCITYGDMLEFCDIFYKQIQKRTLIFVLNDNSIGALSGYLGSMQNRIVPLLLGANMDSELLRILIDTYHPEYLWLPKNKINSLGNLSFEEVFSYLDFVLVYTGLNTYPMYDELSLLLTTSGSTGSPKLVRHSYYNLNEQSKNISTFFGLTENDRALIDLPFNYTYGRSVVDSHLYSGATLLMTNYQILQKEYWDFINKYKATVITGVPYSYEMMKKLRIAKMDLPYLRILAEGAGKLTDSTFKYYVDYAKSTGKQFFATYGQTEASARMAFLPPEWAERKIGSIGHAIPNGKLYLLDEKDREIKTPGEIGEMIYEGPNVTLGYAVKGKDLSLGDERKGILRTGDMAKFDEDGCYYLAGRKKRFIKLFGNRIGLDECELLLRNQFGYDYACVGNDQKLIIYTTYSEINSEVIEYISNKINLHKSYLEIRCIPELPKNEAGKILYAKLDNE